MIIATDVPVRIGDIVIKDYINRNSLEEIIEEYKNQPFKILESSSKEAFMLERPNCNFDWLKDNYIYYKVTTD